MDHVFLLAQIDQRKCVEELHRHIDMTDPVPAGRLGQNDRHTHLDALRGEITGERQWIG